MRSTIDWFARLVMFVLASLATLALIGSFASMSYRPLGDAFPGRTTMREAVPAPPATPAAVAGPPGRDEPGNVTAAVGRSGAPVAVPQTMERETEEIARWLKALTYAVLALAGFAAAGVIALARIAWQLGRVAGR